MRTFEKPSAGALPDTSAWCELSAGDYVDLALNDSSGTVIVGAVADEINTPIVKQQGRVNASLIDEDRIRPFAVDVVRSYIKILMCRVICGHEVKPAVVEADRWCKYSAGAVDPVQHHLFGSC